MFYWLVLAVHRSYQTKVCGTFCTRTDLWERSDCTSDKRALGSSNHCKGDKHFEVISSLNWSHQKRQAYRLTRACQKCFCPSCMFCWQCLLGWSSKKRTYLFWYQLHSSQLLPTTKINGFALRRRRLGFSPLPNSFSKVSTMYFQVGSFAFSAWEPHELRYIQWLWNSYEAMEWLIPFLLQRQGNGGVLNSTHLLPAF